MNITYILTTQFNSFLYSAGVIQPFDIHNKTEFYAVGEQQITTIPRDILILGLFMIGSLFGIFVLMFSWLIFYFYKKRGGYYQDFDANTRMGRVLPLDRLNENSGRIVPARRVSKRQVRKSRRDRSSLVQAATQPENEEPSNFLDQIENLQVVKNEDTTLARPFTRQISLSCQKKSKNLPFLVRNLSSSWNYQRNNLFMPKVLDSSPESIFKPKTKIRSSKKSSDQQATHLTKVILADKHNRSLHNKQKMLLKFLKKPSASMVRPGSQSFTQQVYNFLTENECLPRSVFQHKSLKSRPKSCACLLELQGEKLQNIPKKFTSLRLINAENLFLKLPNSQHNLIKNLSKSKQKFLYNAYLLDQEQLNQGGKPTCHNNHNDESSDGEDGSDTELEDEASLNNLNGNQGGSDNAQ